MIKKISKTEEINKRLEKEGKITRHNIYDAEHIEATIRFEEEMKKVRRDFIRKSKNSEIIASKVILNC